MVHDGVQLVQYLNKKILKTSPICNHIIIAMESVFEPKMSILNVIDHIKCVNVHFYITNITLFLNKMPEYQHYYLITHETKPDVKFQLNYTCIVGYSNS